MIDFKASLQTLRKSKLIDCPRCESVDACRLSYIGTWNLDSAKQGKDSDGDDAILCSITILRLRMSHECHACGYSSVKNVTLDEKAEE